MSRRFLVVCLAIGCLGIGFAGGYLIRGPQKPVSQRPRAATSRVLTSVPDIIGLDLRASLNALQAAGLGAEVTAYRTKDKPRGIVTSQRGQPVRKAQVLQRISAKDCTKPLWRSEEDRPARPAIEVTLRQRYGLELIVSGERS